MAKRRVDGSKKVMEVAKGTQKPKTQAGKARSDRQRRTGQPVTTSNPLFTNMSNPANATPGKVDVSHNVALSAESFNLVVSTFTQQLKVYLNEPYKIDDNQYFVFYVTIFEDLKRAMLGQISIFDEAPLIYRELFEAFTPTSCVVKGQVTQRYFFDPDQVKAVLPISPSGVHWGKPVDFDATDMIRLESPATASQDIQIAAQLFQTFKSQGARWWVKGDMETPFMRDTSVYAYPSDLDNQPLKNTNWQASLETPIQHIWVAGLRMVDFNEKPNRQLNHHVTMYAGPQTHLGYRLSSQLNGDEERYTQVRAKMVDMTELFYLAKAQVLGVQQQFGASTTTNDTQQGAPDSDTVPFFSGDSTAFRVFCAGVVAVAQFRESAAISGYQSNLIGFTPFNYANQFFAKSKAQENIELFFRLIVENLRRLKCISTSENKGSKFVTFNIFGSSPNIAEAESIDYPWTDDIFSATGLSPLTFVSNDGPVAINNIGRNNALVGGFPNYVVQLLIDMTRAQPFVDLSSVNSQREMSGQQLTHLTRYVDTPSGEQLPPPEESRKSGREKVTRYVAVGREILNGFENTALKKVHFPRAQQTVRINDLLIGVYYSLGNKSPSKYRQELLFSLVLPLWPADAPLSKNTDRVVACSTRMADFGQSPTNTEEQSYYQPYILTGIQNTYPRGANTKPTELAKAFANNEDLGLGGNLSDKFRQAMRIAEAGMDGGKCAINSYKNSGKMIK